MAASSPHTREIEAIISAASVPKAKESKGGQSSHKKPQKVDITPKKSESDRLGEEMRRKKRLMSQSQRPDPSVMSVSELSSPRSHRDKDTEGERSKNMSRREIGERERGRDRDRAAPKEASRVPPDDVSADVIPSPEKHNDSTRPLESGARRVVSDGPRPVLKHQLSMQLQSVRRSLHHVDGGVSLQGMNEEGSDDTSSEEYVHVADHVR